jgi:hypothetical protein
MSNVEIRKLFVGFQCLVLGERGGRLEGIMDLASIPSRVLLLVVVEVRLGVS